MIEFRLDLILHRRDELDFHVGLCWIINLDLTHFDDGRVFFFDDPVRPVMRWCVFYHPGLRKTGHIQIRNNIIDMQI